MSINYLSGLQNVRITTSDVCCRQTCVRYTSHYYWHKQYIIISSTSFMVAAIILLIILIKLA